MSKKEQVTTITIPSVQLVSWDDPAKENKGVKHYRFYTPIRSLPSNIPLDNNPRPQNLNNPLRQKMVSTAVTCPESFHHQNAGLFIIAEKLEPARDGKSIKVTFNKNSGICDGGHSYKACLQAKNQTGGTLTSFVAIYVVSNLSEKTMRVSSLSRNTSIANKAVSRFNYMGQFDFFKPILDPSFPDMISYRENESSKRIGIQSIISILSTFRDPREDSKSPIESYLSKSLILSRYSATQQKNPETNEYEPLKHVIKDILYLYDHIHLNLSKHHELMSMKTDTSKKGAKVEGTDDTKAANFFVKKTRYANGEMLSFLKQTSKHKISEAIIYPILAAIRFHLVKDKNGYFRWKTDFKSVLKLIEKKTPRFYNYFVSVTADLLKTEKKPKIYVVGRRPEVWERMVTILLTN